MTAKLAVSPIKILKETPIISNIKQRDKKKTSIFSSHRKQQKMIPKPLYINTSPFVENLIKNKKQQASQPINRRFSHIEKPTNLLEESKPLKSNESKDKVLLPRAQTNLHAELLLTPQLNNEKTEPGMLNLERNRNFKEFGFKLQKIEEDISNDNNKNNEDNLNDDNYNNKNNINNSDFNNNNSLNNHAETNEKALKHSLKIAKEKIIQAKRRILINKDQDQKLFGITAWRSLKNLVDLLPHFHGLKELLAEFDDFSNEWQEFFFLSFKELQQKDKEKEGFPRLPGNSQQKLSPLETLILMKYLRPEEIENYLKNFNSAVFKKQFPVSHSCYELINKGLLSNKHTLVLFDENDDHLSEIIELKGLIQKNPQVTMIINCAHQKPRNFETSMKEIEKAAQKGYWIVIENLELLDYDSLKTLIKKIQQEKKGVKANPLFKVWFLYKTQGQEYKKLQALNKLSDFLLDFFASCDKIFINKAFNIKERISQLYIYDLQEIERKNLLKSTSNSPTILKGLTSTQDSLSVKLQQTRLYRLKIQKKQESFVCLNSWIDRLDLCQRNSHYSMLLDKISEKLRFKLSFIWGILLERQRYELYDDKNLLNKTSYKEFLYLLDDIFHFLTMYPIEPLSFIQKACFFEREAIYQPQNDIFVEKLLSEYVFNELESHMAIEVKGFKYELFTANFPTNEERVVKTLAGFPLQDPIEILGYNFNKEIINDYNSSTKIMQFLLIQEEFIKKKDFLNNNILRSIEALKFIDIDLPDNSANHDNTSLNPSFKELIKMVLKLLKDNESGIESFIELSTFLF